MQSLNRIPLFPLNVVLLPGMPLPLHIFEARYKEMINYCLDTGEEFGIVLQQENQMQKAGCTAKVIQVLKRYDDGRLDILTQGVRRFKIKNVLEEKTYLESEVSFFDDSPAGDHKEMQHLADEGFRNMKGLYQHLGRGPDFNNIEELDLATISYLFASMDGISLAKKQRYLEMTNTRERLEKTVQALAEILNQVKIIEGLSKKNGKEKDSFGFSEN